MPGEDAAPLEDEYASDLGRMVNAVKRLEFAAYMLAAHLGVLEPTRLGTHSLLLTTRREVRNGLPPWTDPGLAEEEVRSWIRKASRVFHRRNQHVHGVLMWSRHEDGSWRSALLSSDLKPRPYQPAVELTAIASSASRLENKAWGFIHPLYLPANEGRVPHPALGGSIPIPLDNEVRRLMEMRGVEQPPDAWVTWPRERYTRQYMARHLPKAEICRTIGCYKAAQDLGRVLYVDTNKSHQKDPGA